MDIKPYGNNSIDSSLPIKKTEVERQISAKKELDIKSEEKNDKLSISNEVNLQKHLTKVTDEILNKIDSIESGKLAEVKKNVESGLYTQPEFLGKVADKITDELL